MRRFNESWIAVARVKANSLRNGRKKIVARFFPAYSKVKRLAHLLRFWCAIKTLGRRITWRSQENFGRHMPISLTRPNMEFATGRVAVARWRARPLAGSQRAQSRKRIDPLLKRGIWNKMRFADPKPRQRRRWRRLSSKFAAKATRSVA